MGRTMQIRVQHVQFVPNVLEPGILYVSKEFEIAVHLCACGCGSKVKTPLGPVDWSLRESRNGPSLYPSIGNWQHECRSHYWIRNGKVVRAPQWTPEQIIAGREAEKGRRTAYYEGLYARRPGIIRQLWGYLCKFLSGLVS